MNFEILKFQILLKQRMRVMSILAEIRSIFGMVWQQLNLNVFSIFSNITRMGLDQMEQCVIYPHETTLLITPILSIHTVLDIIILTNLEFLLKDTLLRIQITFLNSLKCVTVLIRISV